MYDDEGYAFYKLSAEEKEEKEAEEEQTQDIILCYTCNYSKNTSKHVQSMWNCDEPFLKKNIRIVECEGSCAITKSSLDEEGEYLIIRGYLVNCQSMSVPGSSVECCRPTGSMCNGRKPYTMQHAQYSKSRGFQFCVHYRTDVFSVLWKNVMFIHVISVLIVYFQLKPVSIDSSFLP